MTDIHLAAALDGAGWHPAAWRDPAAAGAGALFQPGYWQQLTTIAERGLLDLVTIEDGYGLQSRRYDGLDDRTDHVRGRLDAVQIAARVAPSTSRIGLVPTIVATHAEPFHASTALATLDHVSRGRAGWRVQVSGRPQEAAHFGHRTLPPLDLGAVPAGTLPPHVVDLFAEAEDAVEVVRRLWDSWDDDAIIRDVATGRFIDRDRLHHIDFTGAYFSVKGPSITPRPPQGQPVVTALAHSRPVYEFAARTADVVYVTPADAADAASIAAEVRALGGTRPLVFADLTVFLDTPQESGAARRARLDDLDGAEFATDTRIFAGSADELADLLLTWADGGPDGGGVDGFRLRPGVLPTDLTAVADLVVPILQRRGVFRRRYDSDTLRGHLGLARPAGRYAKAGA